MGNRKKDVRLGGKELFIYYHKGIAADRPELKVGGCTNKRILENRTGIDYSTLMNIFTRKNRCYYDNGDIVILKLFTSGIEKGNQSMVRRGKGGMEKFRQFISNKTDY